MWRFPEIFLSKSFTGYLENNLLWSYLRAMFKEHLSRVDQERFRKSIEGDRGLDRTAETWVSVQNATVELAAPDAPLRKFGNRIETSLDPGQSPEQSSTHLPPHEKSQSDSESQGPPQGPMKKKKRKSSKLREEGRKARIAMQRHSGRKAHTGDGLLQSNARR